MASTIKRFDFTALQDFREPLKALEIVADNTAPEVLVEDAPPPPPPTFSEAELEAAKKQAFEEGRQAGLVEGKQRADTEEVQRDKAIMQAIQSILPQVDMIAGRHYELMRRQCEDASQLVLMAARRVAGEAVKAMPQAGIETMIERCLGVLMHQPKVQLSVHPGLVDAVEAQVKALLEKRGSDCDLRVVGDGALVPGDARLEWKDGMAERDLDALWEQVESKLRALDYTTLVSDAIQGDGDAIQGDGDAIQGDGDAIQDDGTDETPR